MKNLFLSVGYLTLCIITYALLLTGNYYLSRYLHTSGIFYNTPSLDDYTMSDLHWIYSIIMLLLNIPLICIFIGIGEYLQRNYGLFKDK